jgi:hypothetical protein
VMLWLNNEQANKSSVRDNSFQQEGSDRLTLSIFISFIRLF